MGGLKSFQSTCNARLVLGCVGSPVETGAKTKRDQSGKEKEGEKTPPLRLLTLPPTTRGQFHHLCPVNHG